MLSWSILSVVFLGIVAGVGAVPVRIATTHCAGLLTVLPFILQAVRRSAPEVAVHVIGVVAVSFCACPARET
jgi:hypothetical protein